MLEQLEVLALVALAMLLGGAVGFEREMANKPAGLRTHMIVAGAAALVTHLGRIMVYEIGIEENVIRADPIRIIEAVITGITFLGAGTIIRNRGDNDVEGLTTAASLLLVGGIGIGIALGQFVLTIGVTILMLVILRLVKHVFPEKEFDS